MEKAIAFLVAAYPLMMVLMIGGFFVERAENRKAKREAKRMEFVNNYKKPEFIDEANKAEVDAWLNSKQTLKFQDGLTAAQLKSWHDITEHLLERIREEK